MKFAIFGDKKQRRRQNMAEIVFLEGGGGGGGGEVSEIKCIIFMVNNDNTYEIQNDN